MNSYTNIFYLRHCVPISLPVDHFEKKKKRKEKKYQSGKNSPERQQKLAI